MKKLMFTLLLISCLFSLKAQDHGTDGNQFWLAYMENISLSFNGDPQFSVFVSSTESGNATITAPATGLTYSFEYAGNTVTEFVFPPGIFYAQGSEEIKNFGFRINTSTTASVFTAHYRVFFSEASIILPDDLLADEYLVTAVEDFDNALNSPSCLVIVATEDNSEIEITPSSTTAGLRPAGIPFTISLDAGQSYQVQAPNDLTGTKIQAMNGEKLAVFAGGVRADLYCEGGADNHLYDQLFPTSLAALSYVLIPFKEQGNSVFKILALEDNTEISVNETLVSTLQAQEFIELTEDSPKLLTSNKEVLVSQFNPSQSCNQSQLGDPTMLQLHSMHYRIQSTQFMNLSGFGASLGAFSRQCITLFTESENVNGIRLNDQDISAEFIAFP
ncbi:MAG: IgGFc-binding protein, partial [Bacteroidota bacterium]